MKIKHFVRQSLFFSLFLGGMGLTILPARAENLPDIEAHQFKIVPLEKSRTGRVYRFKVDHEQLPKTGSILLIEENDKPTMAFRVLKTDFDSSEFIARRVRRYDMNGELKLNDRYLTIEKLADLVTPPPVERDQFDPNAKPLLDPNPGKTLVGGTGGAAPLLDPSGGSTAPTAPVSPSQPMANNDLSSTPSAKTPGKGMDVEKYDDDLDSSTSPTNLKNTDTVDDATAGTGVATPPPVTADTSDSDYDLEVKERKSLNPYKHMLGFSVDSLTNYSNFQTYQSGFGGFSFYYSEVLKRDLVFKKEAPQDSLSIEYGISYYSDDNVTGNNDDYNLLPLRVDFRYDIHLSETFTPFIYFGLQFNWIISSSSAQSATFSSLEGFQTNLGIGLLYNIGPQWYLRADLGADRLGLGLAVRW